MLQEITHDVFGLITNYLDISDLIALNRLSRGVKKILDAILLTRDIKDDFFVVDDWSSIRRYAEIKSRSKLFPEARAFLDLTYLLVCAIETQDTVMTTYFWQQVRIEEMNNSFEPAINYTLLIEVYLKYQPDSITLDDIFHRLRWGYDFSIDIIHHVTAGSIGNRNRQLLLSCLKKYYPFDDHNVLTTINYTRPLIHPSCLIAFIYTCVRSMSEDYSRGDYNLIVNAMTFIVNGDFNRLHDFREEGMDDRLLFIIAYFTGHKSLLAWFHNKSMYQGYDVIQQLINFESSIRHPTLNKMLNYVKSERENSSMEICYSLPPS